MALTPEQTSRIQAIQAEVLAGKATRDMVREGLAILRQDRTPAQVASTKSRTTAAAERKVINPSQVLADLMAAKTKLTSGPVA